MYISITRQHMGATFSQSAVDYVRYLEKENEGVAPELQEHFFDQYNDRVSPEFVIKDIDGNTAKLKKRDPKFYALTISPSQRELQHIQNNPKLLKTYIREVMKTYANAFYRDQPVSVDAIKYYAKIEYQRSYKGYDKAVKENQPYIAKIAALKHQLVQLKHQPELGDSNTLLQEIKQLEKSAPHQLNGQLIRQGMLKEGPQTHVHVIVSRKDNTNSISLSPGSSHKASEATLNDVTVKRGFHRDQFYENAEKTFDKLFNYPRNFVESYSSRKLAKENSYKYFVQLMGLPTSERSAALKLLGKSGVKIPVIPTSNVQLVLKTIKQCKRALKLAQSASTIGI